MRFFDLVAVPNAQAMAKRLGYSRIFELGRNREFEVIHSAKEMIGSGKILVSDDKGAMVAALRSNAVAGVVAQHGMTKRYVDMLRSEEKVIFISLSKIVKGESGRAGALAEVRGLARNAIRGKAKAALVTLADEKEYMLSVLQALEVAKLAGIEEFAAKRMLSALGEMHDI